MKDFRAVIRLAGLSRYGMFCSMLTDTLRAHKYIVKCFDDAAFGDEDIVAVDCGRRSRFRV